MDKIKVIVIDDKRIIADLFTVILGFDGHDVKCIHDPEAALEIMQREKFDIAFLDIVMPGADGISILKAIRSIDPKLPVVMMSGYTVEDKRHKALELGAISCLKKPFEIEDVRKIVREAIGKEI